MTTFLFRTNAGKATGLGHLVRCVHLAREIERKGGFCIFVIDYQEDGVASFLEGVEYHCLYDSPQKALNEDKDSKKFLHICAARHVDWIILDDYRLGWNWENKIKQKGFNLCCLDDLQRKHNCDMLVDMRWYGYDTPNLYDRLVPHDTKKLLGPDYSILSPAFNTNTPKKQTAIPFTIMIGLGGGGDHNLLKNIIHQILEVNAEIRIFVVLGPFVQNSDELKKLCETNDYIIPLSGVTDLYPFLIETDFYIGAIGGITYQLRCLNIPALTFSIANNQHNDISQLEDIGHYFHVNDFNQEEISHLKDFVVSVYKNYSRIQGLGKFAPVTIDNQGAHRIASHLLNQETVPCSRQSACPQEDEIELSVEHKLRPVNDRDINSYVHSRNLRANSEKMVVSNPIPLVSHYSWWFNTKRESYLLSKNNRNCLYIWHNEISHDSAKYLIGGWFVCNEENSFQDALIALNWQLEFCDQHYPDIPWIAVINRKNKYVKLLNDYIGGFQEIDDSHPYFNATAHAFHNADPADFHYVVREPKIVETGVKAS